MPDPSAPAFATIGDAIADLVAAESTSAASNAAALAADAKAAADAAAVTARQPILSSYLAATGPVTIINPDGTFSTYQTSTGPTGLNVEISKPASTPLPAPAPVAPTA